EHQRLIAQGPRGKVERRHRAGFPSGATRISADHDRDRPDPADDRFSSLRCRWGGRGRISGSTGRGIDWFLTTIRRREDVTDARHAPSHADRAGSNTLLLAPAPAGIESSRKSEND